MPAEKIAISALPIDKYIGWQIWNAADKKTTTTKRFLTQSSFTSSIRELYRRVSIVLVPIFFAVGSRYRYFFQEPVVLRTSTENQDTTIFMWTFTISAKCLYGQDLKRHIFKNPDFFIIWMGLVPIWSTLYCKSILKVCLLFPVSLVYSIEYYD